MQYAFMLMICSSLWQDDWSGINSNRIQSRSNVDDKANSLDTLLQVRANLTTHVHNQLMSGLARSHNSSFFSIQMNNGVFLLRETLKDGL